METQFNVNTDQLPKEEAYATIKDRVQALVLDTFLVFVLAYFVFSGLDSMGMENSSLKPFIFIILFVLYDPLLVAFAEGTIGHKMVGIKVKSAANTSKNVNVILAIIRFLLKGSLGWLSLLTITTNKERRALHDFAGDSVVLKIKK